MPHTVLERRILCFSSYKRVGSRKGEQGFFFFPKNCRIESVLFKSWFILVLCLSFIVAISACMSFFQRCTLFASYVFPILVIFDFFNFKCMLYHIPFWDNCFNNQNSSKTENSVVVSALIFKIIGIKLEKKDFVFAQFYLLFPKTGQENVSLQTLASTDFYG